MPAQWQAKMLVLRKKKRNCKCMPETLNRLLTFLNYQCLEFKKTGTTSAPVFFLILELLLFIVIFLLFLIRWYLSASILSDPGRALGAPRRFLYKKQREGRTGNSRPSVFGGLCFSTTERYKTRNPQSLETALMC